MARIASIHRNERNAVHIGKRQLPVIAADNLMMIMNLSSKGLSIDCPPIRGRELEDFTRKFNLLTSEELRESLEIDTDEFLSVLNRCVQCVGCRRSVERLFYQLTLSGNPTLDPLVLKSSGSLTITEEKLKSSQALGSVLYHHHEVLNNVVESKLRNKTRCFLHSLDTFRSKPFSETWHEVWSSMKHNCRDEVVIIDLRELHSVLQNYLKKHKFCQGCRTKIEKAYNILIGEVSCKEKGFVASLYANIRKCLQDEHIHVVIHKVDFLDALIKRAEPEINGNFSKQRERHAKTLEVAQEEVLTCIGMIMYERLRRIHISLREEDRACQVLAAVGVHALSSSFDRTVEKKQGFSNLELLYKEISRAEKAKEHKREQKKLRKKKRKIEKKNNCHRCDDDNGGSDVADNDDIDVECVEIVNDDDDSIDERSLSPSTSRNANGFVNTMTNTITSEMSLLKVNYTKELQHKPKSSYQKSNSKKLEVPAEANVSAKTSIHGLCATINMDGSESESIDSHDTSSHYTKCSDAGYASDPNSHINSRTSSVVSPSEGSEASCSDEFDNHDENFIEPELITHHENVHEKAPDHDCSKNELIQIKINDEKSEAEFYVHYQSTEDLINCYHDCKTCKVVDCPLSCWQNLRTLTLIQMLQTDCNSIEDDNSYIPEEVVLKYQYQREKVQQQRKQLREKLRQNFARLCMRSRLSV